MIKEASKYVHYMFENAEGYCFMVCLYHAFKKPVRATCILVAIANTTWLIASNLPFWKRLI